MLLRAVSLAIAVAAAAVAGAGAARQGEREGRAPTGLQNLVANGGFERPGAEGMPTGWFRRTGAGHEAAVTVKQVRGGHSGQRCLMMMSEAEKTIYGAYCEPIDLPPDTHELLISFYFKTAEIPQPDVYVLLYGTDFAEREWQTPYLQAEDHAIPQSPGWSLMGWRFRVAPGVKQALVGFRGMGRGRIWVDDVCLRSYPSVAKCQVLHTGLVVGLPRTRRFEARILGLAPARKLRASLVLFEKRRLRTAWVRQLDIRPGQKAGLRADYSLGAETAAQGMFLLTGERPDEVYDIQPVRVPPLLEGRVTRPAFRATVVRSVPCAQVEAVGWINASEGVARGLKLAARLAGTSREMTEGNGLDRPSARAWTVRVSARGLLTGMYEMQVTATGRGASYKLSLPLVVAPPNASEVAYDEEGTLWVNGKRMFPRGLYYAADAAGLEEAKAAGFNVSVVPWRLASSAVMNRAAELGLSVIVYSRSLEYGTERYGFWEHATGKFSDHKALLGWHTVSKPDLELALPHVLQRLYNHVRELDPHHPIMTSLSMPSLMGDYAPANDIVLLWTDPIPQSGVPYVGLLMDEARAAVGPRPVWAIIQAVGHHWSWDTSLDVNGDGRLPTPGELRAMTYAALVHGAKGILYYAYVLGGGDRKARYSLTADAPKLWATMIRINRELAFIEPFLLKGRWHPLELSSREPVNMAYWTVGDKVLVVAVNMSPDAAVRPFRLPAVSGNVLTNVFTGEQVVGSPDGEFGIEVPGYGSMVLAGRLR